ncbi:MAG: transcriptional regulator, TetR family [Acidimicrobiales bacterium]|nr:transcriptional regulator, TetR family [Acidimicrobiales bacterium]
MDAAAGISSEADSGLEARILDATLQLVERVGVAKTSLFDVAQHARCSRATLYRAFPGGKDHLFQAMGRRELLRFLGRVAESVSEQPDAESALAAAVTTAATGLRDHVAFQFVLAHEPGLLLPYLGFKQVDRLYRAVAAAGAPHLVRFVRPEQASWTAEWLARLLITFVFTPDDGVDLTADADARELVRTFLLPALAPAAALDPATTPLVLSPRST